MSAEKQFRKFRKEWNQGKYRSTVRLVSACAATACVVLLGSYYFRGRQAEGEIDSLRTMKEEAIAKGDDGRTLDIADQEVMSTYRDLFLENPDLIGWLTIDGTTVDYPVMWTPEDPEYYSNHGFDRSESQNGLLFLDGSSSINESGGNLIVYGHNMKNGSMFADLLNYREQSYWEAHRTIQLDTLYESRTYEIASVAEANDLELLPYGFTYAYEADCEEAIANMHAIEYYDTGVSMEYGDDFLTLSTCDYSEEDGRLVVMAKRIE